MIILSFSADVMRNHKIGLVFDWKVFFFFNSKAFIVTVYTGIVSLHLPVFIMSKIYFFNKINGAPKKREKALSIKTYQLN